MRSEREEELIQETRAVWQKRYPILLSKDDAQQIITNVTDFFNILEEWDRRSSTVTNEEPAAEEIIGGDHAA